MGASNCKWEVGHHVLPCGALDQLHRRRRHALSAPLLMIGMVAFIVDVPKGFTDPATVLPVQIMVRPAPSCADVNGLAVVLRSFERRSGRHKGFTFVVITSGNAIHKQSSVG